MGNESELVEVLHDWTVAFMHRTMGNFMHYAKRQGLSVSQIAALFFIQHRESGGVSDIGSEMGVTSAAASQMLDRLVQLGLVARSENPDDRRTKQIVLTERGLKMLRSATEERERWFVALAESLTTDERARAVSTLRTLIARVGQLEGTKR